MRPWNLKIDLWHWNSSMLKRRLEKLEAKNQNKDFGLRVVTPIGCFYDDEDVKPYWTDEPVKDMESLYTDEPYRKVLHPENKKAEL